MGSEVRTKIVFLDLPYHCEYVLGTFPLVSLGFVVEFENLSLKDLKNPEKKRIINGPYVVERSRNLYKTGIGLTQYLEVKPLKH